MKILLSIALLLAIETVSSKEVPVLKFDEKITWKDVFDYGFRPKHLEGLARKQCVCPQTEFWIEFKGRDSRFKVERGRTSFSFKYDDFLTMVWHQGEQPISLAEGKRRAEEFSKVFDGYVVQEMTLPRGERPHLKRSESAAITRIWVLSHYLVT